MFLKISVRFSIGATIRMGRESWCFPYAGFFCPFVEKFGNLLRPKKKKNLVISFEKISLRRRHALIVEDGAFSHKID